MNRAARVGPMLLWLLARCGKGGEPSPAPVPLVGHWELEEQGDRVTLDLDAAGAARLAVGGEEVLGRRDGTETRYEIDPPGASAGILRLACARQGVPLLTLAMRFRVSADTLETRTFFNDEAPESLGAADDPMRRVFHRARPR